MTNLSQSLVLRSYVLPMKAHFLCLTRNKNLKIKNIFILKHPSGPLVLSSLLMLEGVLGLLTRNADLTISFDGAPVSPDNIRG